MNNTSCMKCKTDWFDHNDIQYKTCTDVLTKFLIRLSQDGTT